MKTNSNVPKKFKFFGIENASPTFQKIITKYKSKRKNLKEKPKSIMAFVEKARFKAENYETEDEYMLKELRNDRKFTQQLIFLYGQRAEKHYNEINNHKEFKTKINKNYFFTPEEILKLNSIGEKKNSKKGSIPLNADFIFNKKKSKSIFFPRNLLKANFTFNKERKNYNSSQNSQNSTEMFGFYNTTSNISTLNNNKKRKNEVNKISISKFLHNNTLPTKVKKEDLRHFETKTDSFRDRILALTKINNNVYKSKTNDDFYLNKIYMDKLAQINNDFTKTKNKFRNHFRTNDYGCHQSKLEYEYLNKKFFNNKF